MSDNTVSLATAQADIANWKEYCIAGSISDRVKAYNIPLDSIAPLLELEEVASIRAYIGLPDKSAMAGMHLFIVGVDSSGDDIIEDAEGKSLIYELTTPCPDTCAPNSPLNI